MVRLYQRDTQWSIKVMKSVIHYMYCTCTVHVLVCKTRNTSELCGTSFVKVLQCLVIRAWSTKSSRKCKTLTQNCVKEIRLWYQVRSNKTAQTRVCMYVVAMYQYVELHPSGNSHCEKESFSFVLFCDWQEQMWSQLPTTGILLTILKNCTWLPSFWLELLEHILLSVYTLTARTHTKPGVRLKWSYAKSPGWQPTLCVAWCLICWFALAYKKYGHTWHRMSLLRPGVIKQHTNQTYC